MEIISELWDDSSENWKDWTKIREAKNYFILFLGKGMGRAKQDLIKIIHHLFPL
jgi:hypothetical protein